MKNALRSLLPLLLVLCSTISAKAETYIPPQLSSWVGWVTNNKDAFLCAQGTCEWPTALEITAGDTGASFTFFISVDKDTNVILPGSDETWPIEVKEVNGATSKDVSVIAQDGKPVTHLKRGRYQLTGKFSWSESPSLLTIPEAIALVSVTKNGKVLTDALGNEPGTLVLDSEQDGDATLSIAVAHRMEDSVPFRITSWLSLKASGKPQTITLKDFFPKNATLLSIETTLGYQLKPTGELIVSIPPGEHEARINSIYATSPSESVLQAPSFDGWPAMQTVSWYPHPEIRSVDVLGASPVDQARVELPDEWKGGQLFSVASGSSLTFQENKGTASFSIPNNLTLSRRGWLTLDGTHIVSQDTVSGTMHEGWRLNATPTGSLEQVSVNGANQVITADPKTGEPGVEVRSPSVSINAQRIFDRGAAPIPAVGWNQSVSNASFALSLPPGWTLLHATGADDVQNSWVGSWTLYELFFTLLIAISAGKVFGRSWGILSFLCMALTHDTSLAPRFVWLHLLAVAAMLPSLPNGNIRDFVRFHGKATLIYLGFFLFMYAICELMRGFFPSVSSSLYESFTVSLVHGIIEESIYGWILMTFSVWLFLLLLKRKWSFLKFVGLGVVLIGGFIALTVIQSISSSFFRSDSIEGFSPQSASRYESALDGAADYLSMESEAGAPRAKSARKVLNQSADFNKPDPNAVVQTGRGLPSWKAQTASLSWSGTIEQNHTFSLYLLSPAMNLVMSLIKVALVLLLGKLFLQRGFATWWSAATVLLFLTFAHRVSAEDFPPKEYLDELETRMLADTCSENCSFINSMHITIRDRAVTLNIAASSSGESFISLPGPTDMLLPAKIEVDGQAGSPARKSEDNTILVRVSKGVHTITVQGAFPAQGLLTLQVPMIPGHTSVDAPQWKVEGIDEHGVAQSSLSFAKIESLGHDKNQEATLPYWYVAYRTLQLGADWRVVTTVNRLGDNSKGSQFNIPLLEGEVVITPGVKVANQQVTAQFDPGTESYSWTSTFTQRDTFSLTAGKTFTEVWKLACSPVWQCSGEGFKPASVTPDTDGSLTWNPTPGQQLNVAVVKPKGIEGLSKTITQLTHTIAVNDRLLSGTINLTLTASRGGYEVISLPPDATFLRGSATAGSVVSLEESGRFSLPIIEGQNQLSVEYTVPTSSMTHISAPQVTLESTSANVTTNITIPASRWILFTRGDGWGGSVLFWVKIACVILGAWILSRLPFSPLTKTQWIMVGLSVAVLSVFEMGIIVIWFLVMEQRKRASFRSNASFNLMQIGLALLSFAVIALFIEAIRRGLLFQPDMTLAGSYGVVDNPSWYLDYVGKTLPQPSVYTLPLWAWRFFMLVWASWLVFNVLRWIPWAFENFTSGGMWKTGKAQEN